jgi:hypothetical protein
MMLSLRGRTAVQAIACLLVSTLYLVGATNRAFGGDSTCPVLKMARINLDAQHLQGFLLRAFVATGSDSPNCLVTLAEAGPAAHIIGPVFCGTRTFEGRKGVLVSVFYPFEDPGDDVSVALTLYHEGARGYRAPTPYYGD